MYLAPLNYDRYFRKVFSDERIAQRFLEDFLGVTITSLERLPEQHRVTDNAAIVEFDYRCKINDGYVIVDMQQWYKPDIVQRFYLYHALNTGLQLEHLPKQRFIIDRTTMKMIKVKDYRVLEPVLTLIWLVEDTLQFKENYVSYIMTPQLVLDFLKNDRLWHQPEILKLLTERTRVLEVATNSYKELDFLSQNRLIFMLQQNIVKQAQGFDYERWFRFAEKSRNRENTPEDFEEFEGDEVFEQMIKRLNQSFLTEEDYEYIEHEQEMWEEVARLEHGYYQEGRREGWREGRQEGWQEGKQEGWQEGRQEGKQEGRQNKAIETARKMLAKGYELPEIADLTGLDPADLSSLAISAL